MDYVRDPFLEKWRHKEQGEEDVYFARRDRQLIEKLREIKDAADRRHIQELVRMRCPDCGETLVRATHSGVTIAECAAGHGMWITPSQLRVLAERERNSWITRYFYQPKPVI